MDKDFQLLTGYDKNLVVPDYSGIEVRVMASMQKHINEEIERGMNQYHIEYDYNFGKFVGVVLRAGSFSYLLLNSLRIYIGGYGDSYTRMIRDFVMEYLDKRNVYYKYRMHQDSTSSINIGSSDFVTFLRYFLVKGEGIKDQELTVDNIIKYAHDKQFIQGIVDVFNEYDVKVFDAGANLSFIEEEKFWGVV